MGWASRYIQKLLTGETVSFRPHGHSMSGRIESGQLCIVVPIDPAGLEVGDIVLCRLAAMNTCTSSKPFMTVVIVNDSTAVTQAEFIVSPVAVSDD
jgi:hypothetical protein